MHEADQGTEDDRAKTGNDANDQRESAKQCQRKPP